MHRGNVMSDEMYLNLFDCDFIYGSKSSCDDLLKLVIICNNIQYQFVMRNINTDFRRKIILLHRQ